MYIYKQRKIGHEFEIWQKGYMRDFGGRKGKGKMI